MSKVHEEIGPEMTEWVKKQHIFFVGSAPLAADGHINCSPKGLDTLRILGPKSVAYLDLTGSGAETIAHLRENGRIVFMFCAFDGPPKIVRFHGTGQVILPESPKWAELAPLFPDYPGARAIIYADVTRVSDSCGHGIPNMIYTEDRDLIPRWAKTKGPDGLIAYRKLKNTCSMDGLPSLDLE